MGVVAAQYIGFARIKRNEEMRLATSQQLRRFRKISRRVFWLSMILLLPVSCTFDPEPWRWPAASLALGVLALTAYLVTLRLGQRQVQRELQSLMDHGALKAGAPPVVLFLRSFDVAEDSLSARLVDGLFVVMGLLMMMTGSTAEVPSRLDAEERLDDAIGDHGVFLAIGNKRASYGSAKIVVDDAHWKQTFAALTDAAKIVFMIPGPSEAVRWEMSQILASDTLRQKTIVIMPRERHAWRGMKSALSVRESRSVEARSWAEFAAIAHRDLGLMLPAYNSEGCCFRLDSTGHAGTVANLEGFIHSLTRHLAKTRSIEGTAHNIEDVLRAA